MGLVYCYLSYLFLCLLLVSFMLSSLSRMFCPAPPDTPGPLGSAGGAISLLPLTLFWQSYNRSLKNVCHAGASSHSYTLEFGEVLLCESKRAKMFIDIVHVCPWRLPLMGQRREALYMRGMYRVNPFF